MLPNTSIITEFKTVNLNINKTFQKLNNEESHKQQQQLKNNLKQLTKPMSSGNELLVGLIHRILEKK